MANGERADAPGIRARTREREDRIGAAENVRPPRLFAQVPKQHWIELVCEPTS